MFKTNGDGDVDVLHATYKNNFSVKKTKKEKSDQTRVMNSSLLPLQNVPVFIV
jgi:hypothetical protein